MDGGQRLISWLHPCLTSNVALTRAPAVMGHSWAIQIGPGVTFTPLKEPTSSSVQLTCPVSTHTPCRVPHPRPTRACICPHTDSSKCPGTFPFSARPYASCALCLHTDPYEQPRGSALIPFVTPHPPKPHRLALP
jgi:hypothetical protein